MSSLLISRPYVASMPRDYISGLQCAWSTPNKVVISPGKCRDSLDTQDIVSTSTITIAAGADLLGPALSANTRLSVWLIRSSNGGIVAKFARDWRISTFQTYLSAGQTARRIGAVSWHVGTGYLQQYELQGDGLVQYVRWHGYYASVGPHNSIRYLDAGTASSFTDCTESARFILTGTTLFESELYQSGTTLSYYRMNNDNDLATTTIVQDSVIENHSKNIRLDIIGDGNFGDGTAPLVQYRRDSSAGAGSIYLNARRNVLTRRSYA